MKKPESPPKKDLLLIPGGDMQLFDILSNQLLRSKLAEIEKDYPYWDKFKYEVRPIGIDPAILWSYTKMNRESSYNHIKLDDSREFQFKYNIPGKTSKYLHRFDLHLGGILEGRSIIPSEDKNRYLISSIMEEAIASSQLEGAATTREIAKEMLRSNRKPRTLSEKMIVNNYLTIKKVLEIKDQKITKELLLTLHEIISKDTLADPTQEGRFRNNNDVNVVDGITNEVIYIPPGYEKLDTLIASFCAFANAPDGPDFIHPIIRGIILHFLIGYIHPFADGNGRTARAVFYWYLLSKGYWLVEYMSISKIIIKAPAQYARAYLYTEYDENDLTYFIDYNLKSLELAMLSLQKYIQRKVLEKKNLIHLIQHENINERQAELLKNLIIDNQKSFTIKEVQNKFGVVYQTARVDLLSLQSLGYIKEKKLGKKLIFFREEDLDSKLEKLIKN